MHKDEGQLSRRPGDNGRETPPRTCAEKLTLHMWRGRPRPCARRDCYTPVGMDRTYINTDHR